MSRIRPLPLALVLSGCPEHAPAWYDFTGADLGASTGSTTSASTGSSGGSSSSTGSTGDEGSGTAAMSSGSTSTTSTTSTSGTSTTDALDSSTSGAPGFCGDGVVDPGEECDDGNAEPDDRCDVTCLKNRIVFATRDGIDIDFLDGIAGADSRCRQYANKAGHEGWLSFRAWLSDSNTHAGERLHVGPGRYLRPDGVLVVHDAEQFLSGQLEAPIAVDEYGDPVAGSAWTGTRPDGTAYPGSKHCFDWTMSSLVETGVRGLTGASDGSWTMYPIGEVNPTPCDAQFKIYCIEGE